MSLASIFLTPNSHVTKPYVTFRIYEIILVALSSSGVKSHVGRKGGVGES